MIYTVFFKDKNEMPQDFATYEEANEYAEERKCGEYEIVSNNGEIV